MDAKLEQLVEEAIEKGITSQSWLLMLTFVIAAGLSAFLGAYLKKRGEHKAQNEVFGQLLDQLVKQTSATEKIKGNIAKELATFESDLTAKVQFKIEILLPRVEAYKPLWALTYNVRPTRTEPLTGTEKSQLAKEMTAWYYNLGNGIFLSSEAGKLWRQARKSLATEDDEAIKNSFSSLRTQIKIDISVYGQEEAETEIGT